MFQPDREWQGMKLGISKLGSEVGRPCQNLTLRKLCRLLIFYYFLYYYLAKT
jgi:hypothetical protein